MILLAGGRVLVALFITGYLKINSKQVNIKLCFLFNFISENWCDRMLWTPCWGYMNFVNEIKLSTSSLVGVCVLY